MARRLLAVSLLVLAACSSPPPGAPARAPRAPAVAAADDHVLLVDLLLYVPNRVFDLFDVVRARVRLGPGLAVGVRATEYADLYLGAYASLFVGIPGSRDGESRINWPLGLEGNAGAEASIADFSTGAGSEPDYGEFEFGLGFQLLVLGVDVGVEPWELVDFVAGILTFDPVGDDL